MKADNSVQLSLKRIRVIVLAVIVLCLSVLLSLAVGTVRISAAEIMELIRGETIAGYRQHILMNIRLPRIVTGLLAGLNLSLAGMLLQGILRNPMASPNTIGVNAGAGFAAVIVMTIFPGQVVLIPVAAFVGALLTAFFVYTLSLANQHADNTFIILAGMAIAALLSALTSALMLLNAEVLDITFSWLLGSLSGRSWSSVTLLLPYTIAGFLLAFAISPKINMFILGDEMATSMGLSIRLYKALIIIIAAVLAGSAVSVAGTIGFVGLIAPHVTRLLIGVDYRYTVPLSCILGAILLVLSDTVARTIFQPIELSVGIVTAVLGAPFFLMLFLNKGRKRVIF